MKQANLNGFLTWQMPSLQAGTYGVIVWYKKAANAGKFKLFAGSRASPTVQIGGETDAYRSTAHWTKVNRSSYWIFIDAIQVYRAN